MKILLFTGADLGKGGGGVGLGFCTILKYPFLVTDPKNFLKASLGPMYTNFEGERDPKKHDFLVNIFQKVPKNASIGLFFLQNFASGARNLAKTGNFSCFWEAARKINLVDLKEKKGRQNF